MSRKDAVGKTDLSDIGAKSLTPSKKSVSPVLLGLAVGLSTFLVAAAGFFAYPRLMNVAEQSVEPGVTESMTGAEETSVESKLYAAAVKPETDTVSDEERELDELLTRAESLSAENDLRGALAVLSGAPIELQSNERVSAAVTRYTSAAEADVLSGAKSLSDKGSFGEAVAVLTEAAEWLPESAALTTALNDNTAKYNAALRESALQTAREQAEGGEYIDAIVTLRQAVASVGSDDELISCITEYETAYTESIAEAVAPAPTVQTSQTAQTLPEKSVEQPREGGDVNVVGGATSANAAQILLEDVNHASFTEEKQVAWYKVTTSANHSIYHFELLNNSVGTSVYIKVYDEYERQLGEASGSKGENGYVDLALEAERTYLIGFSRSSNDRLGNYQFSVLERVCDAGTERSNAYEVLTDTQYVRELDAANIDDWFTFTVGSEYSSYRLELQNNSIKTTTYFKVYDEYETKVGECGIFEGESGYIDLSPALSKRYHMSVSRSNDQRLGYYQFDICEKRCDAGIDRDSAFELALPATQNGTFDTAFNDWYKVTIPSDGSWRFELTNNSINTTTYMTVYDIYEKELYNDGGYTNDSVSFGASFDAGTELYIRISRSDNSRLGKYTLNIVKG